MKWIIALAMVLWAGTGWAGDGSRILECDISKAPTAGLEAAGQCAVDRPHIPVPPGISSSTFHTGSWKDRAPSNSCTSGDLYFDAQEIAFIGCEKSEWVQLTTSCQAKMEAAMRAMDPWRVHLADENGVVTVPGYGVSREDAVKQWDAVKRECWRP